MLFLLRFLLVDRPDRRSTTPLHTNRRLNRPPDFRYGHWVHIWKSQQPIDQGPTDVVADATRRKRMADPHRPTRVAWLFQVYLVREPDWLLVDMPPYIRRLLDD